MDGDTRVELGNASNVSVSQGAETFRAECKSWGFKSVELQHAFVSEGAPAHLLHVLGCTRAPATHATWTWEAGGAILSIEDSLWLPKQWLHTF